MKVQSLYGSNQYENKVPAVKITEQEKKYFAKLYPENKEELMNYHYYEKNGKLSGVKVGSLFDRKG